MSKRRKIQIIFGLIIYTVVSYFNISIGYVIILGGFIGIIFGKVFCRWMCPMGVIMEWLMSRQASDEKKKALYQYHKIGCPIAWISGYFNKMSIFQIKVNQDQCIACGACDASCYISTLDEKFSVFQLDKQNSGFSARCSRCLACVQSCSVEAIKFKK